MYAWIDGERWAADGQPALTEAHGLLRAATAWDEYLDVAPIFGRIMTDDEEVVIVQALVRWRAQPLLPVTGEPMWDSEEDLVP
jgi:hypothetical protein